MVNKENFLIVKGEKIYLEVNERENQNQKLSLVNKKITDLTKIRGLNNLYNIDELDLSNNHISEIKNLDSLRDLKTLILRNNQITEIDGLKNLTNLMRLDLSFNFITEIKGLENQKNLISLNLKNISQIYLKL